MLQLDWSIQVIKEALLVNLDPRVKPEGDSERRDTPVKSEHDDKNKSNHDNRDILS